MSTRNKITLIILSGTTLLLLFFSVIFIFSRPGESTLVILSDFNEAEYEIDGIPIENLAGNYDPDEGPRENDLKKYLIEERDIKDGPPFTIKLAPGKHSLKVSKEDYLPYKQEFNLKNKETKKIEITLTLTPRDD